MIHKFYPGLKLIVSYADPDQGHRGSIYQAGNWIYAGQIKPDKFPIYKGRVMHPRTLSSLKEGKFVDRSKLTFVVKPGKHKYLYAFDPALKKRLQSSAKPYPRG